MPRKDRQSTVGAGHKLPPSPLNQPYVEAFSAFLTERGLSKVRFIDMIYGPNNENGYGAAVYSMMRGTMTPSPRSMELIKDKTGLDLTNIPRPPSAMRGRPTQATTAREVAAAYEAAKTASMFPPFPELSAKKPAAGPPRFSLVIEQDGTARFSVNLTGVSADEAMRYFVVLSQANLLQPGNKEPTSHAPRQTQPTPNGAGLQHDN